MANNCSIKNKIWDDAYIFELKALEKLIFIYLLTNDILKLSGIFEIPVNKIALHTKIKPAMVRKILLKFENDGKIKIFNSWVAITNYLKHQNLANQSIVEGIEREVKDAPQELKDYIYGIHNKKFPLIANKIKFFINNSNTKTYNERGTSGGREGDETPPSRPYNLTYTHTHTNTHIKKKIYKKESEPGRVVDSAESPVVPDDTTTCILEKPDEEIFKVPDSKPETKNHNNGNGKIPYAEIINYLNQTVGTHYLPKTNQTQRNIQARWKEGFRENDFKTVIKKMSSAWGNDPKMSVYLRPETLFGTKFESYLNRPDSTERKLLGQSAGGIPAAVNPPYDLPEVVYFDCEWCDQYRSHTWDAQIGHYVCCNCNCEMRDNEVKLKDPEFREKIVTNESKEPEYENEEEMIYAENTGRN